jgi:hypothetical protein
MNQQEAQKLLFKKVKLNKTTPEEIEQILTQNNIDINVTNGWNETLIYNCCKHAVNVKLLDWLYEKGCDPTIINNKKFNAFNACLEWNHKKSYDKVLDWLLAKNLVVEKYYKDKPIIHNMIICHGNDTSLPWIAKHYNVNEQDKDGNTALHMSVHQSTEHNSPTPCIWLCKNGAKVNTQNKDGDTPLHLACYSGFSNCIKTILEVKNCDYKIKNKAGKTAYDVLLASKDDGVYRKWGGDFNRSLEIIKKYDGIWQLINHLT